MLSKFLKKRVAPSAFSPAIPAGERVYAIGDIHGRLDLLDDLLAQIDADDRSRGAADTTLVFLGDLVDRGPDSAGVVERLLGLSGGKARFLLGNHEEVFLTALDGDARSLKFFCRFGGRETILSYGVSEDAYNALDYDELAVALAARVPAAHRAFIAGFEDMIRVGDYVFVHAGIRPDVALADQRPSDLRWIREPFISHRGALEAMVVHGHTILPDIDVQANRIGIDTGAFSSGRLSALGLESRERWVLQTNDE